MTSPIPLALLEGALSIVGTTGAGKTFAAKGAVEQLLVAGRRVCIVDPLDVWYGLKTSADGEQPAFPVVVFGGEHADVPIDVESGAAVGKLIAGGTVHQAIICTANMTGGETARFLASFFEALYAENKAALHLVLDEADAFAPQNPMPEAMRMKGAVDKIARRGRVKGFRLLTITQRPAVLDKSVLSQISTLVAMKLTSAQDRKAIEAWIKGTADEAQAKDVLASLPKLARGEGWVWSPAAEILHRVAFPAIATLDTSRTPEHGETIVEARAAAAVDIDAIRVALTASIPVEKINMAPSADAGAALRGTGETATDMAQQVKEAEVRGYRRGLAEGEALGFARGQALQLARMRAALDAMRIEEFSDKAHQIMRYPIPEPFQLKPFHPIPAGSPVADDSRNDAGPEGNPRPLSGAGPKPSAEASADGTLNSAARKMLAVLDTNPPVRRTWAQVATLAGLKARGGHFNAGKKALTEGGYVVYSGYSGDLVEHANPSPGAGEPPTAAEVVERWCAVLSGAAPKILRFLFGDRGDGLSRREGGREWIAEQLGMQPRGGHWNAAWKELRDNGLVEFQGRAVRLHPDIFGGRP